MSYCTSLHLTRYTVPDHRMNESRYTRTKTVYVKTNRRMLCTVLLLFGFSTAYWLATMVVQFLRIRFFISYDYTQYDSWRVLPYGALANSIATVNVSLQMSKEHDVRSLICCVVYVRRCSGRLEGLGSVSRRV